MICTESVDIAYVFSILLINIFIIYSKNTYIYIYMSYKFCETQ